MTFYRVFVFYGQRFSPVVSLFAYFFATAEKRVIAIMMPLAAESKYV